jgi:prephenate dehydratase
LFSPLEAVALQFTVAFQGEIGAYSQSAVFSFFGRTKVKQVRPLPTFSQVFASLFVEPRCDFAVVPIENSLAGSVGESLDLLRLNDVRIIGEVKIPIEHLLLAQKNTNILQIKKVISHPQALAQCRKFLDSRQWQQVAVYDTAGAAKMIKEENLNDTAAIAGELAGEIYHLKVLARGIEDDSSNSTRFVVIARSFRQKGNRSISDFRPRGKGRKTSVIFSTQHLPGSLVNALSTFSTRGINLTKVESRPMKSRPWEYYFFVDFEGDLEDPKCAEALRELQSCTSEIKVLGSYASS